MKHIRLFEDFLFEGEPDVGKKFLGGVVVSQQVVDYIKKSPKAKQSLEYCKTLATAMQSFGTDEAAIFSVFSKIKTKGEMIQLMAIWDMNGWSYGNVSTNAADLRYFINFLTGRDDAYGKKVSNRINLLGRKMKDLFITPGFWNSPSSPAADAYMKARAEWFKKNPSQQKTNLFYWLREELDTEELAKLNGIIKKFGMKISA